MIKTRAILINNIFEVVKRGEQNNFRYLIGLSFLDDEGKGWVKIDEILPFLSEKFNVTPETVKRKLSELEKKSWGAIDKPRNRFFYIGQKRLGKLLDAEYVNQKAVIVQIEDLSQLKKCRALFELSLVAGTGKNRAKIISRQTRRDNLLGSSENTQRKYEKEIGVEKTYNFAILGKVGEVDEKELAYQTSAPIFKKKIKGVWYWLRQLPNTFNFHLRIIKRKIGFNFNVQKPKNFSRLYYEKTPNTSIIQNGTICYIKSQTKDNLFFAV